MIRVSYTRDWARGEIERHEAEWGIGATAERLAPSWLDDRTACTRNGSPLPRDRWSEVLADGDSLHFYARPGFIPGLSPALFSVLGQAGSAAWNAALVSGLLSAVVSRLLLPSKRPTKRGDNESSTWGFNSNAVNVAKEGTGIPVAVGRHRSAPPIITQFVRTRLDTLGNPFSELHTLLLVSEGPIAAIGDKTEDGGPFSSELGNAIVGLQLNNQPAETYRDVEAHVRLGSNEQTAIPGIANPSTQYGVEQTLTFERAKHKTSFQVTGARAFSGGTGYTDGATVTLAGGTGTAATFRVTASAGVPVALSLLSGGLYSVAPPSPASVTGGGGSGLTIEPDFDSLISAVGDSSSDPTGGTNTPGSNTAIATTGSFSAGSTNITKWNALGAPVSYTMGEEADEFAAIISLPQGLGDFTGTNPAANTVVYQVRYQQVDGLGVAFGNVVVLDPERLTLSRNGAFQVEFRRTFKDPSTYTAPGSGLHLRSRTGNAGTTCKGASYVLDSTKVPVRSKALTDFSFACWIRPNASLALSSGPRRIVQWFGTNTGFRLSVQTESATQRATLTVDFGDGTATNSVSWLDTGNVIASLLCVASDGGTVPRTMQFAHLAITFDGDGKSATSGLLRIYMNGVLRFTSGASTPQLLLDAAATLRLLTDSTTPTAGFNADLDEVTVWTKTLSAFEIARLYNSKFPVATSATADGLLVGFRFDAGATLNGGLLYSADVFGPATNGAVTGLLLGDGLGGATPSVNPEMSNSPTAAFGIVKTLEGGTALPGRYRIDIMRISVEDAQVGLVSELQWDTVELTTFQKFQYPSCALLYVVARATDQLNGGQVPITVRHDGLLMPVWDGVDPLHPTIIDTFTRNPAWIAAGILTSKRWGLGGIYSIASLDLPMFKVLADYCDELIYDNDEREVLVTARQLEAADTATDSNMAIVAEDCVRYRFATLPRNFPQATSGKVSTGKFITLKTTGTPSPSVPAWLTTQINAGAQEVVYVAFDSSGGGGFNVYCKSSAAVASSSTLYTPGVSTTNYLEGEIHAARYYFDGVFDQTGTKAWDAVVQVLQVARAAPVRIGSRVTLFVDKPGTPVALVGMGSVIAGSWRSNQQGIRGRHNAEEAEFFDEDQNYERRPVEDELPDVTDPTKASASHKRRVKLEGITRRGQAKRHLRRDLNQLNLQRRTSTFEMGVDALPFQPGDLIDFSHDVPGYGISGRVLEDAANTTTFKHDREDPIVLEVGKTYQVQLEHAASNTRETKTISSPAGTYTVGTTLTVGSAFAVEAAEGDEYVIGETGKLAKTYRVVECTRDPQTMRVRLTVIEYDPQVYEDDFGTFSRSTITNLPAPSAPAIPPGVENLVVTEETTRGPDGHLRIGAQVAFTHVADTYHWVEGTDVYVARAGQTGDAAELVARLDARTTSCRLNYPFERDVEYQVFVEPRAIGGQSMGRRFISWSSFLPSGLAKTPKAIRAPKVTVSGELAVHAWEAEDDLDYGATVEIRQGGWILGLPVCSMPAQARATPPIAAGAGGPVNALGVGAPSFYARVKLKNGQYGPAAIYTGDLTLKDQHGAALSVALEDDNFGL